MHYVLILFHIIGKFYELPYDIKTLRGDAHANAKAMALTGRVHGGNAVIAAGGLKVDTKSHRVWNHEQPLSLPPKEYEMLLFFLENPGQISWRRATGNI